MPSILALSGSLRASSSNTAVLEAIAALTPADTSVTLYCGLAGLPAFNPDREDEPIAAVADLRQQLTDADGLLISSPEYAHGVPGSLKNALDWVVGSGELIDKPVGVINASPYSTFAQASLIETLKTMNATVVPEASITVSLRGKGLDANGILEDAAVSAALREAAAALCRAIEKAG